MIKNYISFCLYLILNPRLVLVLFKVYLPTYIQYEWVKKYKIGTFIDVGAYKGTESIVFKEIFPKCDIYSFEPQYIYLKNLVNRGFHVENSVLGDKVGKVDFYTNKYAPASSVLELTNKTKKDRRFLSKTKKIIVNMTTLDNYFKSKSVSGNIFLKIDTQGSEDLVLKGGIKFLEKVLFIHLETSFEPLYKNQPVFEDIYKLLTKNGFCYFGRSNDSDFYPLFGVQLRENSLFVNKKLWKLIKK